MALVVNQISAHVSGDIGGPGISRFHCTNASFTLLNSTEADAAVAAVHAFFNAGPSSFPSDITWTIDPLINGFLWTDAAIAGSVAAPTPPAPVVGSSTANYAAGVGGAIFWHTNTIRNRRVMRGRTFLVPLAANAYTTAGLLTSTVAAAFASAAQLMNGAFVTAGLSLCVWGRPTTVAAANGVIGEIDTATCSTTPSTLRSRRS